LRCYTIPHSTDEHTFARFPIITPFKGKCTSCTQQKTGLCGAEFLEKVVRFADTVFLLAKLRYFLTLIYTTLNYANYAHTALTLREYYAKSHYLHLHIILTAGVGASPPPGATISGSSSWV
jgi:hypothetical protein